MCIRSRVKYGTYAEQTSPDYCSSQLLSVLRVPDSLRLLWINGDQTRQGKMNLEMRRIYRPHSRV